MLHGLRFGSCLHLTTNQGHVRCPFNFAAGRSQVYSLAGGSKCPPQASEISVLLRRGRQTRVSHLQPSPVSVKQVCSGEQHRLAGVKADRVAGCWGCRTEKSCSLRSMTLVPTSWSLCFSFGFGALRSSLRSRCVKDPWIQQMQPQVSDFFLQCPFTYPFVK